MICEALECASRVTEALLTQLAATVFQALTLANQIKQMLLDFLCRLKLSSSAVTKKTMRMLNHGACQVKVHQLHATSLSPKYDMTDNRRRVNAFNHSWSRALNVCRSTYFVHL